MTDTSSIVIPAVAVVAGAALGAAVSGYLTIQLKAMKRWQKRRAEVYVDMLAWIGARMPELARKAELKMQARDARVANAVTTGVINIPPSKVTYPDPAAGDPDLNNTAPGSPFFVALRARIVVFASHDTTRAFDRWTAAFKDVTDDLDAQKTTIALHNLVVPAVEPESSGVKRLTFSIRSLRDPGIHDDSPGNLTKAIERCVSAELRKG
jgi:hypothetical protein